MNFKKVISSGAIGAGAFFASAVAVLAATVVVVTPTNTQGWSTADTRPGGAVNFIADSSSPAGVGARQLTTDNTNAAKAQYLRAENVAVDDVTELSYHSKQNSASFPGGAPSYQFIVDLNGASTGGFTTFVYEPYQNGVVTPGVWQSWDVDGGQFWSSRTFTEGTCSVTAGAGGAPFYTLAGIKAMCPDAVALGFGVNVGTFNPSYDVEADLVSFNDTAYDFEPYVSPSSKDDCKKGGWMNFADANGNPFKNQGQCVSYFNHSN